MSESIDDWPTRYRALSIETEKEDDYFKASLLKSLNSQSLCATIYENDTITLSLLSSFDIHLYRLFVQFIYMVLIEPYKRSNQVLHQLDLTQ